MLYTIIQQPDERFSIVLVGIPNYDDIIALFVLKRGLFPRSGFLDEICNRKPRTITKARARAQGMIEVEDSGELPNWNVLTIVGENKIEDTKVTQANDPPVLRKTSPANRAGDSHHYLNMHWKTHSKLKGTIPSHKEITGKVFKYVKTSASD